MLDALLTDGFSGDYAALGELLGLSGYGWEVLRRFGTAHPFAHVRAVTQVLHAILASQKVAFLTSISSRLLFSSLMLFPFHPLCDI
jgi:hypothetical protein